MDTTDLKQIAGRIMNDEQQHDVDVFLREGKADLVKDLLRRRIDILYSRSEMTREIAMELYNRFQLPPELARTFHQRAEPKC